MKTYKEILIEKAKVKYRMELFEYNESLDGLYKEVAIEYAKEVLDDFISEIFSLYTYDIYFSEAYIDKFKEKLK